MKNSISFVSIDSSLRNTGLVAGETDGINILITSSKLIRTKKDNSKKIRASSDTISRCKKTFEELDKFIKYNNPMVIFAETPSGSQNSSAMKSYGATCQLLATLYPSPIQITPIEAKIACLNNKKASKIEIIKWAYNLNPHLDWLKDKKGKLMLHNEHIADAIAIAYAGINRDQFTTMLSVITNVKQKNIIQN